VIALTIYSRPGCHLCDDMKDLVARVVRELAPDAALATVDISTDAGLEARYGLEIPVLEMNGKKIAKYRVDEGALRRMLATQVE
jgi:glutaredoxin